VGEDLEEQFGGEGAEGGGGLGRGEVHVCGLRLWGALVLDFLIDWTSI